MHMHLQMPNIIAENIDLLVFGLNRSYPIYIYTLQFDNCVAMSIAILLKQNPSKAATINLPIWDGSSIPFLVKVGVGIPITGLQHWEGENSGPKSLLNHHVYSNFPHKNGHNLGVNHFQTHP